MVSDEIIQEKYMQLQMLAQTMRQVQQQLQMMDEQGAELERVIEGLESITSSSQGTKLLVPISEGIFAHATIQNPNSLLVNVGGNVVVNKTGAEAKVLLEKRMQEMREHRERMDAQMNEIMQAAQHLQKELGQMVTSSDNV